MKESTIGRDKRNQNGAHFSPPPPQAKFKGLTKLFILCYNSSIMKESVIDCDKRNIPLAAGRSLTPPPPIEVWVFVGGGERRLRRGASLNTALQSNFYITVRSICAFSPCQTQRDTSGYLEFSVQKTYIKPLHKGVKK
jgi:hypothetical protein